MLYTMCMEDPASAEVELRQRVARHVQAAGYSQADVIPSHIDTAAVPAIDLDGADVNQDQPKSEIVDTIASLVGDATKPVMGGSSTRVSDNDWVINLELKRQKDMNG